METVTGRIIEWGIAGRPLAGQQESGDLQFVRVDSHEALVAVVDGLGHGEEAAAAARIAIATIAEHPGESPIALVQHCYEKLRYTRGVVMSLAALRTEDDTMTWIGVGNVEGLLLHWDGHAIPIQEGLLLRPGVVGDRQPRLIASVIQIAAGDLLIFTTDGIRPGFTHKISPRDFPQQIADRILVEFGQETDDALVVVVRYLHGQAKTVNR